MSIVRQKRANGSVYLYESHNVWDKERKKVRAVRTHLGREGPETGELIPSSGTPGRESAAAGATETADYDAGGATDVTGDEAALQLRILELERELERVSAERDALCEDLSRVRSIVASALSTLTSA